MSKLRSCLLALAATLLFAGCHGPGDPNRPVDCEGVTNTLAYFGPECLHFPNSNPPCPYFSPPEAFHDGDAGDGHAGDPSGSHACTACRPSPPPLTELD